MLKGPKGDVQLSAASPRAQIQFSGAEFRALFRQVLFQHSDRKVVGFGPIHTGHHRVDVTEIRTTNGKVGGVQCRQWQASYDCRRYQWRQRENALLLFELSQAVNQSVLDIGA